MRGGETTTSATTRPSRRVSRSTVDQRVGVAEADRGGVDDDVGAVGHGVRAVPGHVRRGYAGARGHDARELLAAALRHG